MNRSFLRILAASAIIVFLISVVTVIGIVSQSSRTLLAGGVKTFPQATAFVPKQSPAMVSLLVNPEKLYGLRQVTLPLKSRYRDRTEWLQWITSLIANTGLDYRADLKPWLGNEFTLAITALDFDRNLNNGIQPGYLLVAETKNTQLTQQWSRNFYSKQSNISLEQYKGANIISSLNPAIWSNATVGKFVLYANHPEILKQAINQAQAVNLNLEQSEDYQNAIALVKQPHVAMAYINVPQTSAWLDKLGVVAQPINNQTLSAAVSINQRNLAIQTSLTGVTDSTASKEIYKSLIHNPELKQFFESLSLEDNTDVDLAAKPSLSQNQIPRYEVTRLAIKSMFPHLDAIAISSKHDDHGVSHGNVLFKLDHHS